MIILCYVVCDMYCYILLCYVALCYAMLCYAMFIAMLWAMLRYAVLCFAMPNYTTWYVRCMHVNIYASRSPLYLRMSLVKQGVRLAPCCSVNTFSLAGKLHCGNELKHRHILQQSIFSALCWALTYNSNNFPKLVFIPATTTLKAVRVCMTVHVYAVHLKAKAPVRMRSLLTSTGTYSLQLCGFIFNASRTLRPVSTLFLLFFHLFPYILESSLLFVLFCLHPPRHARSSVLNYVWWLAVV